MRGGGGGATHPGSRGKVWAMADDGNKSGGLGDLVKAESMIQLALALPAGCLIGLGIGVLLDKHFHTGWIAVAGVVVGAIAGFTQIFKTASRFMKRGD
jgi:ATP synthase protein I